MDCGEGLHRPGRLRAAIRPETLGLLIGCRAVTPMNLYSVYDRNIPACHSIFTGRSLIGLARNRLRVGCVSGGVMFRV